MRKLCTLAFVLATLAAWGVAPRAQQLAELPAPLAAPEFPVCGVADLLAERRGSRTMAAAEDGAAGWFLQDPPILTTQYTGTVTLRQFLVVGDQPTARFRFALDDTQVRTWDRVRTTTIGNRLVSVFEPSFDLDSWRRLLRYYHGWDDPGLYVGEFLPRGTEIGKGQSVYLRFAPRGLPRAPVVRVSDRVQYASHVANVVSASFGNGRITTDDHAFELAEVARQFYETFEDGYDVLAFNAQAMHVGAGYAAFHSVVQSDVRGIGLDLYDNSAAYGSRSARLHGVEMFVQHFYGHPRTSNHETAHQWGAYIDWTKLLGITGAGHQPTSHDPLFTGGETLIGAVLRGDRRVRRKVDVDGWEIEATPRPFRFHPWTLYAMGLKPKEDVPEVTVFEEQGQFDATTSISPDAGKEVTGGTKSATIYNAIGMLGEREGPVPGTLRKAIIVVSRDALMSQAEMDYWNFVAQRSEDPNHDGTESYSGYQSLDETSGRRLDLQTDIRPIDRAPAASPAFVSYPTIAAEEFPGVKFNAALPSHIVPGQRLDLAGVVTATDPGSYSYVALRWWKATDVKEDAVLVYLPVSSAGSFTGDVTFRDGQQGVYALQAFIFKRGNSPAETLGVITPVFVK